MIHNRDRPDQTFASCESRSLGDQDIGAVNKLKYPVLTGFFSSEWGNNVKMSNEKIVSETS
jgi:hypothetical protein